MKRWLFREQPADTPPRGLARELSISPLLLDILWRRGLDSPEELDAYLSARLPDLVPPSRWPQFPQAAEIIASALLDGKKLAVWGDYDVDGITASTLVLDVLEAHGLEALWHVPDRRSEGYGLNIPAIEQLAAQGCGILLTVDCGISDVAAVARARELGMTVVVSDHHLPPPELPPAHAVCNPRLGPEDDMPCPHLAGVGVAFFLMAALNGKLEAMSGKRMDMRQVLDLVALGTLADMVSLTGQNRILVKNGLLKIAEAKRPGLAELKGASGFSPVAALGAGQVVFNLAPRINAAGRLGSPTLAHDMLLTPSHDEAAKLAQTLTSLNDERRSEEDRIYKEALEQAEANPKRLGFVLYGKDWHQGVIGIVASRIVEVYYRPVLILCSDGESLKGSGRSVPEFDLHAGLTRCADMLLGFGGHRQAAGLRIAPGRLDELRERFDAVIREELGEAPLTPSLKIDAEMPFSQASDFTVLKGLELLQPFGIGNPEPIFASLPLRVKKRKAFGHSREHISLEVTEEGSGITLQAKAWRQADQIPESIQGQRIRLAYTPGINAYNGIASVELRVRDWEVL